MTDAIIQHLRQAIFAGNSISNPLPLEIARAVSERFLADWADNPPTIGDTGELRRLIEKAVRDAFFALSREPA